MEIGVDIGGTKTHVVVADDGGVRHERIFATASWRHGTLVSDPANAQRLVALIPAPGNPAPAGHSAKGGGEVPPSAAPSDFAEWRTHFSARDSLAVGAHGCDNDAQCQALRSHLSLAFPGAITVVNDAQLLGPAMGLEVAIGVVAGTGSIVVGTNSQGGMITRGGYGWILGDPGSAPGITRECVLAILKEHDAGRPPSLAARLLMAHYQVADPIQLGYEFCNDLDITSWGSLAPTVFEAAAAGCPLAQRVIDEAARGLASDVHRLRQDGALGRHVVLAGGVITHQELLADATTRRIGALDPDLEVVMLTTPPVYGALALARGARNDARHPSASRPEVITSPGGDQ